VLDQQSGLSRPSQQRPPYQCTLQMMSILKGLNPTLELVGRLFNTGNFDYYQKQVLDFLAGKCAFCPPDPTDNVIFDDISNATWMAWENIVAPRPFQDHQLLFAPRRHVVDLRDLTQEERLDMFKINFAAQDKFGFTGYSLVIRCGDPDYHAGSVRHIHANMMHPDGTGKVEVTLGKSKFDFEKKLPTLLIWEKMRLNLASGHHRHDGLTLEELEVIKPKDKKPKVA